MIQPSGTAVIPEVYLTSQVMIIPKCFFLLSTPILNQNIKTSSAVTADLTYASGCNILNGVLILSAGSNGAFKRFYISVFLNHLPLLMDFSNVRTSRSLLILCWQRRPVKMKGNASSAQAHWGSWPSLQDLQLSKVTARAPLPMCIELSEHTGLALGVTELVSNITRSPIHSHIARGFSHSIILKVV